MFKVEFDGCQYGLKSIRRGMEDHFIKKPWAFATDMFEVAPTFQKIARVSVKPTSMTHAIHRKLFTANTIHLLSSHYYITQ